MVMSCSANSSKEQRRPNKNPKISKAFVVNLNNNITNKLGRGRRRGGATDQLTNTLSTNRGVASAASGKRLALLTVDGIKAHRRKKNSSDESMQPKPSFLAAVTGLSLHGDGLAAVP